MALIGLVRVSTDKQQTQRQHDALDPICLRVIEEKTSGKLATEDRPDLLTALSYLRDGDLLTVQEVDRLGRNLLEGLIVLNDLFQRGVGVKVLEGIAAGEHTERSLILDLALALAEDRRRDIVRKTKDGLEAARRRGRVGGRRPVVDDDKRAAILARRERGESIRTIAAGVKVSVGVVHKTLTQAAATAPAARPAPTTDLATSGTTSGTATGAPADADAVLTNADRALLIILMSQGGEADTTRLQHATGELLEPDQCRRLRDAGLITSEHNDHRLTDTGWAWCETEMTTTPPPTTPDEPFASTLYLVMRAVHHGLTARGQTIRDLTPRTRHPHTPHT